MLCRTWQSPIHRHITDQRVEIAAPMNTGFFHVLIQQIATERIVLVDQDGEVGAVANGVLRQGQQRDAEHPGQSFAVAGFDFLTTSQCFINILKLQQAKSSVDFAHFPVDARRHNSHFTGKPKVFQVVDTLFGLGIPADNGAAFKGVEYLGGVKTEHGEISMGEQALAFVMHAEGMGGIVDDFEPVSVGNFLDTLDLTGVAVAVYR